MARESSSRQIQQRQMVAQQAARLMAEEGIADYAFASVRQRASWEWKMVSACRVMQRSNRHYVSIKSSIWPMNSRNSYSCYVPMHWP